MVSKRVRRQIEEAAADRRLVKVRRHRGWHRLEGAIVDHGPQWLLLAVETEAAFDGHALLRVEDVREVRDVPPTSFIPRALALEGRWPLPGLDGVDLSSTRSAVGSLGEVADLLAVHRERDRPGTVLIGVSTRVGRKKLRLRTVDPAAGWDQEETDVRHRTLTRIDVGDTYARRLAAVAGPPPSR